MLKIASESLNGDALNWAVAKCEGFKPMAAAALVIMGDYQPAINWALAGPIIEREELTLDCRHTGNWQARIWKDSINNFVEVKHSPTALIAAMRCYVMAKIGAQIDIPEGINNA
jgi:hypothetical protein